jgi:hypothetical protein
MNTTTRLKITRSCLAGGEHRAAGYEGEFSAADTKSLLGSRRAILVERNPAQRRELLCLEIHAALHKFNSALTADATGTAVAKFVESIAKGN